MKTKILELMRSPAPDAYALGFELCAVHYPELLFEIDEQMKEDRETWRAEHENYKAYALEQYAEWAVVGRSVPCDCWGIDIWSTVIKDQIFYSLDIFNNKCFVVAHSSRMKIHQMSLQYHIDSINVQLQSAGWQ